MKNKNGFTLIELLAVIVILAILMVAAGSAVISTMNNARVNTFKDEALQAIDSAKMMYADVSFGSSAKYIANDTHVNSSTSSKGMCVTLKGLVDNGYMEKNLGEDYKGIILVIFSLDGTTKYYTYITNGTYALNGIERNDINAASIKNGNIITDLTEADSKSNSESLSGTIVPGGASNNPIRGQSFNDKMDVIYNNEKVRILRTNKDHAYNFVEITCINSKI